MKSKHAWLAVLLILPLPLAAQAPSIITMAEEPHHHLALHNEYVNVYNAEAAAGDSLLLHRHNKDAIAIAIGDQTVTVGIPGKPDVHTKNTDGQVRMQLSGYVHSTRNDGQSAYHTVAIELLHPQTGERNLCATVLPGKPLNCPAVAAKAPSSRRIDLPQFASDQTHVQIVRVIPHQDVKIANPAQSELIVALDPATITPASGKGPDEQLRAGEFLWFEKGAPPRTLKNGSTKEVRFIELAFKPSAAAKSAANATKPAH
jgi:quercetin dioxygenase-like cupin family protein